MSDVCLHVYVIRDGAPCPLAHCEEDGLGMTLRTLRDEEQIKDGMAVGILERRDGEKTGRWLVSPWQ